MGNEKSNSEPSEPLESHEVDTGYGDVGLLIEDSSRKSGWILAENLSSYVSVDEKR